MENAPSKKLVLSKLILYIAIAMLTTMINEFNSLTVEEMHNLHLMHWITKFTSIILPGLVAWRAFIDQSITSLNNK
jgi:hypothetical protein